jgi:hypothetical protein
MVRADLDNVTLVRSVVSALASEVYVPGRSAQGLDVKEVGMSKDFGPVVGVGEGVADPVVAVGVEGNPSRSALMQKWAISAVAQGLSQRLRSALVALAVATTAGCLVAAHIAPAEAASVGGLRMAANSSGYPPQPRVGAVPGFTSARARSLVAKCEALQDPRERGATLRAVARNAHLTTLVLTTTSGWQTCAVAPDGVPQVSGSAGFQTWAAGDGWISQKDFLADKQPPAETAKAPTAAPDYYLTGPVQVVFVGSGVLSASGSPYGNQVIGRATADVARVSAIMPNGKVASAPVENGMFIIDQVTLGLSDYGRKSPKAVRAYDRAGRLIFTLGHSAPSSQPGPAMCYVTPAGKAVNKPVPGQSCKAAVPWG